MTNFEYFISTYKNRDLLIDTNLLIVLFVGNVDQSIIEKVKPTRAYTKKDYQKLVALIKHFNLVTTSHILAEASNLCEKIEKYYRDKIFLEFSRAILQLIEIPFRSQQATNSPVFLKLGLTDSVIHSLGKNGLIVLTDDFILHDYLLNTGIVAANMNHFRSEYLL